MVDPSEMLSQATRLGATVDDVLVVRADESPRGPSHRWVVVTTGARVIIGGFDRGEFASYAEVADEEEGAAVLASVTASPAAPRLPRSQTALVEATRTLAQRIQAEVAGTGARILPPESLPLGTPLDHIGNESGHCLYLFATPFGERSLPPTDLSLPRTGYVLNGQLPEGASVEVVPPWFGQPGGGVMLRLGRVIRYYCDTGLLQRFVVEP